MAGYGEQPEYWANNQNANYNFDMPEQFGQDL